MPSSTSLTLCYVIENDQYREIRHIMSIHNIVCRRKRLSIPKLEQFQANCSQPITPPFLAIGEKNYSYQDIIAMHNESRISEITESISPPENYSLLERTSALALIEEVVNQYEDLDFSEGALDSNPVETQKRVSPYLWSKPIQTTVRSSPPLAKHSQKPLEEIPLTSSSGRPVLTQVGDQYYCLKGISIDDLEAGLNCLLNYLSPGRDIQVKDRRNILIQRIGFSTDTRIHCVIGGRERRCTL